jgi:hypothetical protein
MADLDNGGVPQILGVPRLLLHQSFERAPMSVDAQGGPVSFDAPESIAPGEGYATVSYSIGTNDQRKNLAAWIQYLAATLPATIGNSSGTYVVTLTLKGGDGKLDIREPIIAIQWTSERSFLFFDKTVNDVKKTQWAGTLIDRMRLSDTNKKIVLSVEISFHKDRSLDFEFLKQASKAGGVGSLVSLVPLPAASLAMLETITTLINSFYTNATTDNVVNSEEVDLTSNTVKVADLPISSSNGTYYLPINVSVTTQRSRLVDGGLVGGKFDTSKISQTLFEEAQIVVSAGKSVGLAELVATAADEKSKRMRSFIDALATGAPYAKEDLGVRCGDLVAALDSYVSKPDARAVFWAFLQRYAGQLDRDKALGQGTLRAELANLGLTF